jgi:hypothetical protein
MELKYVGLKPVISEHGISFKDGKEDKYVYLSLAIDILIALDHNYVHNVKYSHTLNEQRLAPNEILEILLKSHPNLENTMDEEISAYTIHLDKKEEDINNQKHLTEIEKQTYIANLRIMRDYLIQRAKNKIFYLHCIDTIAQSIIHHKIKELDTPFNEKFWHILQTIEGKLSLHKVSSNLKVENLKAILIINC